MNNSGLREMNSFNESPNAESLNIYQKYLVSVFANCVK